MDIRYQREFYPALTPEEFTDLLIRSTLAERRPVRNPDIIRGMLEHADLLLTARAGGLLVGISRAVTDFSYCAYLSGLAVDQAYKGKGIGKALVRMTHEAAGLHTTLVLLSAPKARTYYPHIGMKADESCWIIPRSS